MRAPKKKVWFISFLAVVMFLVGISAIYAASPLKLSHLMNFVSSNNKDIQSDLHGVLTLCEKDPVKYGYLCDSDSEKPKSTEEKLKELVAQKLATERNAKISKLTTEQKKEYEKLTTQTNMNYLRRVAQLLGDLPLNQSRITLVQAKEISLNPNINTVIQKLGAIHGEPDLETGSGLTVLEY